MALIKPGTARSEHKVYDTTDRTCYLCHLKVAEVAAERVADGTIPEPIYYTTENHLCLCYDHRESDGIHGQYADRVHKPNNAFAVVRLMHSSTYRPGRHERKRQAKAKEVEIKAKDVNEEFGDGDVTPEIAAFLKQFGSKK